MLKHFFLLLLPGPLWSGVEAPDSVVTMSQIELFNIQTVYFC